MEYSSAIKRNDILIRATREMNLKNITWNEKKPDTEVHILQDSIYMKFRK